MVWPGWTPALAPRSPYVFGWWHTPCPNGNDWLDMMIWWIYSTEGDSFSSSQLWQMLFGWIFDSIHRGGHSHTLELWADKDDKVSSKKLKSISRNQILTSSTLESMTKSSRETHPSLLLYVKPLYPLCPFLCILVLEYLLWTCPI